MSMFSPCRLLLSVAVLTLTLCSGATASNSIFEFGSVGTESARLATFDNVTGETSFALSITPQIDNQKEVASDIVVYIDTSASQTGMYRKDTLVMVRRLLTKLNAEDRVKLYAVDIEPVELTTSFVAPDSDEIKTALDKLRKRIPLGATDVPKMLEHAATSMDTEASRNKNAIYIGDGISRGQFLKTRKYGQLVNNLVSNKVAVSSFAIGPERDIEALSAIANQTGGNVYVDTDEVRAISEAAKGLAKTVHSMVFWPTNFELPENVAEVFPATVPPLRTDRDSILIGTLKKRADSINFTMTGEINGQSTEMNWPVNLEASNVDFGFLPKLVRDSRKNLGVALPTVGSDGLREMARVIEAQSTQLAQLGTQALIRGDYSSAKTLGKAALGSDPINSEAEALLNKAMQDEDPFGGDDDSDPFGGDEGGQDEDPFGGDDSGQDEDPFGNDGPTEDTDTDADPFGSDDDGADDDAADDLLQDETEDTPEESVVEEPSEGSDSTSEGSGSAMKDDNRPVLPNQIQPGQTLEDSVDGGAIRLVNPAGSGRRSMDEIDRLLSESAGESADILNVQSDLSEMLTDRLKVQVRVEMQRARDEVIGNAPGDAVGRLKSMIDVIDQLSNVDPLVKADLRARLVSQLMSTRRSKLEYEENLARAQENNAIASEIEEARARIVDREIELSGLINRFETLLNEGQFASAEKVTRRAREIAPENPAVELAYNSAGIVSQLEQNLQLRREREIAFLATLYEAEKSATAFPAAMNGSENPPLLFPDAAEWEEKVRKRNRFADVRLAGNKSDERILTALDEEANLKYDEIDFATVMEELGKDPYNINVVLDASASDDSLTEDTLITFNVRGIRLKNALRLMLKEHNATYIVRNEVLTIISLDVATDPEFFVTNVYNVGDLVAPRIPIGGGGIGGGGGFGGGGQGGGGFGGGGRGGGGGGLGGGGGGVFCVIDELENVKGTEEIKRIISPSGDTELDAWSDYFENHHPAPARVRLTVRELMKEKETDQLTGLILGAIQHGQTQPWMYEALVLALQIGDKPEEEIARALSSAVDLSFDKNDVMIAAKYMIDSGLEKRAIGLLKQIVDFETNNPEAFVMALDAARKINDVDGIMWSTLGIFNQAWPTHREVVKRAILASAGLELELKKQGREDELKDYLLQRDEALYRDCIIKVSWTGDADVDLYVEEPGGTICSRNNQRTTAGGIMMGDAFSEGPDASGELSEYYVLPRGFSGDYRVMVRKVWGDVTANKVTVTMYNHYRTDKQISKQRQIDLGKNGSMVLFTLADGRRQASLEEHAVAMMAEKEIFVGRNALAKQFRHARSSEAVGEYYRTRTDSRPEGIGGAVIDDQIQDDFLLLPRAAGYAPQITQLFEGAQTAASATTADRLYVLINSGPFFSQITEVVNFNTLGNAQTAGGAGGTGGGFGGGGGGIGGGMF